MKQLLYLITLFVTLFLYSCDIFNLNQEPTLPELTQEGAGTFGCLIDGELFLPSGTDPSGGMRGNPNATYTEISGSLIIEAQNINNWLLSLVVFGLFEPTELQLNQSSAIRNLALINCRDFYLDSLTSSINISFIDFEEDIISGTFSGTFINECDSSNIVEITQGRFDLNYTL